MSDALDRIDAVIDAEPARKAPEIGSLKEFLLLHARVKMGSGEYGPYSLEGREAFEEIIDTFDLVMGSHTGEVLTDAELDIAGGAQIGKTIFELNFGAYVTAVLFLNWGLYLPDDDIVEGVVDTKLRPDVIEQIDWLPALMAVGKGEDKNGKSVDRKGAFRVSDGKRKAFGMIRGMGKIPTTFSMDVAMEDERDDIPDKRSKFLTGRMSASKLRMRCSIGTQRVHGRGQQKRWAGGSKGVMMFEIPGGEINLEENWPQVCRMAITGTPRADDPRLTLTAEFEDADGRRYAPDPAAVYYLADPATGAPIDRRRPRWEHRAPEKIKQRKWSWRFQQLGMDAMDLRQIVSRYQAAVADPESMVVFCCDVLGLPRNTSQAIGPEVIERARGEFDLSLKAETGKPTFAGLDTGDRCWFVGRKVESARERRITWAEQIPLGDVVRRSLILCDLMGVDCLLIDARPHAQQARQICWTRHGLDDFKWPQVDNPGSAIIKMGDLTWDGPRSLWIGLRAAVVEFTRKPGQGIAHRLGEAQEGGVTRYYPIIQASRYDAIDRVVGELLTPAENMIRVIDGELLETPLMRLPRNPVGAPPIIAELESHFSVGSERDAKGEFVDDCENHLLLANAYSALAEQIGGSRHTPAPTAYEALPKPENEDSGGGLFGSFRRAFRGAI